jgi:putative membrane protein
MLKRSEQRPSPYEAFVVEEMILRDHLAVDRTALANERTFLSYIRTALAFGIGGASVLHFLAGPLADVSGVALLAAGAVTGALGVQRYLVYRHRIEVVVASGPAQVAGSSD